MEFPAHWQLPVQTLWQQVQSGKIDGSWLVSFNSLLSRANCHAQPEGNLNRRLPPVQTG
jgi:hypothetical protein